MGSRGIILVSVSGGGGGGGTKSGNLKLWTRARSWSRLREIRRRSNLVLVFLVFLVFRVLGLSVWVREGEGNREVYQVENGLEKVCQGR